MLLDMPIRKAISSVAPAPRHAASADIIPEWRLHRLQRRLHRLQRRLHHLAERCGDTLRPFPEIQALFYPPGSAGASGFPGAWVSHFRAGGRTGV